MLFINRGFQWRDGLPLVPGERDETAGVPRPLLIWPHWITETAARFIMQWITEEPLTAAATGSETQR